jgi:hypothetical protein
MPRLLRRKSAWGGGRQGGDAEAWRRGEGVSGGVENVVEEKSVSNRGSQSPRGGGCLRHLVPNRRIVRVGLEHDDGI